MSFQAIIAMQNKTKTQNINVWVILMTLRRIKQLYMGNLYSYIFFVFLWGYIIFGSSELKTIL